LTGITQETVDVADVLQRHNAWLRKHCGNERIVIAGAWDIKTMLPREVKNNPVQQFLNVKEVFEFANGRKEE